MTIQEIIVAVLVLICVIWVFSHSFSKKKRDSPCDTCASGCELHDLMQKKEMECRKNKGKMKKSRRE